MLQQKKYNQAFLYFTIVVKLTKHHMRLGFLAPSTASVIFITTYRYSARVHDSLLE